MTSLDPHPGGTSERIEPAPDECVVLFHRFPDDNWPLMPAEAVPARLRGPFAAELTGIPVLSHGISRGDIVAFSNDGARLLGRHVRSQSGHSTAHVVATRAAELTPIAAALRALGAEVQHRDDPTMLAVDIPADVDLIAIAALLSAAGSMTCNFEISCDQHTGARQ
jgi:Domain of unknown function (DUF4265)